MTLGKTARLRPINRGGRRQVVTIPCYVRPAGELPWRAANNR
jgi:hypothetical protein